MRSLNSNSAGGGVDERAKSESPAAGSGSIGISTNVQCTLKKFIFLIFIFNFWFLGLFFLCSMHMASSIVNTPQKRERPIVGSYQLTGAQGPPAHSARSISKDTESRRHRETADN